MKTLRRVAALACTLTAFGVMAASIQPQGKGAERPVAIVGERVVGWSELGPLMAEAAGGQVLEEYALGVILKEEAAKRSIRVGAAEIDAERALLGQMLASAARVPESEAERLIAATRRTRGLGEGRFKALLERNAALRAMVRAGVGDTAVAITPEDIDTAYELKYGTRVCARLILVRSQAAAAQASARLAGGAAFAEVASEASVDPSGARGGLLEPFSLSDPAYPVAVRRVLQGIEVGKVSEPIAVTWGEGGETGFAIVVKEKTIEPAAAVGGVPSRDAAAKELEKEIRTVRERAQMDKLARQLLRSTSITAMDAGLNWSWEQRGK